MGLRRPQVTDCGGWSARKDGLNLAKLLRSCAIVACIEGAGQDHVAMKGAFSQHHALLTHASLTASGICLGTYSDLASPL